MKAQHMEDVHRAARRAFNEVIAGRAVGGMSVLEGMPEVRCAAEGAKRSSRKPRAPKPAAKAKSRPRRACTAAHGAQPVGRPRAIRACAETMWSSARKGDIALAGERFAAPKEAILLTGTAKCHSSISRAAMASSCARAPGRARLRREFLVRRQVCCAFWPIRPPTTARARGRPIFMLPRWHSSFRLVQIWEGGQHGATCVARGTTLTVGRNAGDMTFAE